MRSLGTTPEIHAVVVSSGKDVADFGAAARIYRTHKLDSGPDPGPGALPMDNLPDRFEQLVIGWKLWMERAFN